MMRSFVISIPTKYYWGDQIKKNEMGGACATWEERRGGESEGKKSLGRPKHRWENIKVYLEEVGWDMDWIDLVQYRNRWQVLCVWQ